MANARSVTFGIDFGIRDNELKNANQQVDLLKGNVNQSTGALNNLGASAITAGNQLKMAFQQGINVLHRYRYQLLGAFTAAAAVIGGTIKSASDFQYQIKTTGLVANATASQIEKLTENAKNLGIETAFTAKEAAKGQEILARAGFEVSEIFTTLPSVLDAAAIEELELSSAAGILTGTLRGMQLDVSESRRVIDVLAETSRSSKAEIAGLGEALPQVAAQASGLGIEIEELSAALGLLADQNTAGSRAGRLLRGVLQSLTAPSSQAKSAISDLGINLWDSEDQFKSLTGVVQEFETALSGMSSKEQQERLGEIFSGRRLIVMQQLLNAGSNELMEFNSVLEESGGVAEYMAQEQLDTLRGSINRLRGSLNVASINIQSFFLPVLSNIVDGVTGIINTFNELPQGTQSLIGGIGLITAGFLGILTAVAFLKTPLMFIGGVLKTIGTGLGLTAGKALIVVGVLVGLYLAFEDIWLTMERGYDGVMVPLINKFLDFIGVGYDFQDVWDIGKEKFQAFADALLNIGSGLTKLSGALGKSLIGVFTFDKDLMKEAGEDVEQGIKELFTGLGIVMFDSIPSVISAVLETGNIVTATITSSLSYIGTNLVNSLLTVFEESWNSFTDWFHRKFGVELPKLDIPEMPDIKTTIQNWWNGVKSWINDNINPLNILKDKFGFEISDIIPDSLRRFIPGLGNDTENTSVINTKDVSKSPSGGSDDSPSIMGGSYPVTNQVSKSNRSSTKQENNISLTINSENEDDASLIRKIRDEVSGIFTEINVAETGGN